VTRGRIVLFAVGAASLVTMVVPGPTPASAVDAVDSGWWSRGNGGGVPPPPGAPADGLQVAADPVGPSAVAAVRFTLAPGEANPVLALTVATAGNPTSATLTACRAKARWTAAQAGPWSSRPDYDCGAGVVAGAVPADQKTATFDLGPLVDDRGVVDVVLFTQPGAPPSGVPATPVSPGVVNFTFAKVTAAAVQVDGTGGDDTATGSVAPPLDVGEVAPSFDLPSVTPAPSVDLALPAVAPPTPAPTPASAPARVTAPTAIATPAFAPASIVRDDRRTRLLCAFVFADIALWWYWVTFRRPQAADVRPAAPPLR
jgi:hypothetical protein